MTINTTGPPTQRNAASTGIDCSTSASPDSPDSPSRTCTIDDLPTEILQAIFTEACGDGYIWVSTDSLKPSHHPGTPPLWDVPIAITLLHVSSRWKAITSVTRTLWERVGLSLSPLVDGSPDTSYLSLRRLTRVLKYARKAPMSVSCEGVLDNDHHATLCVHLFQTSNQWKHARLHLTGTTKMKPILSLKGQLTSLESLDLYLMLEQPTEDSEDVSRVFRRAPLLVHVTCNYDLWAFRFPWAQILYFSGTFSHDVHFHYVMRSLERRAPQLQTLFLKGRPRLTFPPDDPLEFTDHHRVFPSLDTLSISNTKSASRMICPSLTNLSVVQHVYGQTTYTLLTVASSLVASSRCSLTSFSINYLRPMPHELAPLRQILMLSPNMECLSIIVTQREPRRINRVARLMLDFFKSCADVMRYLRSLSIELVVRDEEVCYRPGLVPPLELSTFDSVAALVETYAPPPFQAHHDERGIAVALFSSMGGSEFVALEFTAASQKTLGQILECRMSVLELTLKVRQTETGCDSWVLCIGPKQSV